MKLNFGVLGEVEMEECERYHEYPEGIITHSGYTAQGIRVLIFKGSGKTSSFVHGEMWRNAIMIDQHSWSYYK